MLGGALLFASACGKDKEKETTMVEQIDQEGGSWEESSEGTAEKSADAAEEGAEGAEGTEAAGESADAAADAPAEDEAAAGEKININKASAAALDSVPGIGPKMAQLIVEHREANGDFASIEDLKKIKGVGEKTFEKIAPHVTVSGGSAGAMKSESSASTPKSASSKPASSKKKGGGIVNVNTASASELQSLPGVGAKTADLIIAYRDEHGAFKKPEDLRKVKGIGPKSFEKMKDYVSVK